MPDARAARERGLTDEKTPAAVVRTAGVGSSASDAASMAAVALYPLGSGKSIITFWGIPQSLELEYKRYQREGSWDGSHAVATPLSVEKSGRSRDSVRSRARRRAPPAL